MFFLNLTAGEFLALLGGLGGLITALYLLDRAKRKKVVSTLRFWTSAPTAEEKQTRKRMRDPWSLLIQLVSLLLLLLAIAQLQWGTRERAGRDHVLLLDTSAWSAAFENPGQPGRRLIDREKSLALAFISGLPARDRAMIVYADALATPATPFTGDRAQLKKAISEASAGWAALNIDQALSYAQQAQTWSGGQIGEIVYTGPKQIDSEEGGQRNIRNLRVLGVPVSRENAGILRMNVKHSEEVADEWQASITVRNYGSRQRTVRLKTRFNSAVFAPRVLNLPPQQETITQYVFATSSAGQLVSEIDPADNLITDNSVALALPRNGTLRVAVYTPRPETLRPLLEANHRLSIAFYSPVQYQPNPQADVMLLDEIVPGQRPTIASLWIKPPPDASPLPIKTTTQNAAIDNWNSDSALGTGLHAKETRLNEAEVFQTFEGDIAIASTTEGPVAVARPATAGRPKLAVLGFDPLDGRMKFEITTPLLFANVLHWLSPEPLRTFEVSAGRVGAATVSLERNERPDQIRVTTNGGEAIPFTIHGQALELFTGRPRLVRIDSAQRERVLSLTLPGVAEHEWRPPTASAVGLPPASIWSTNSVNLWKWLASLGAIGLLAEWMLFGWRRTAKRRARGSAVKTTTVPEGATKNRELVLR